MDIQNSAILLDIHNSIFGYLLFDFWISKIRFLDIQYSALFINIQKETRKLADSQTRSSHITNIPFSHEYTKGTEIPA